MLNFNNTKKSSFFVNITGFLILLTLFILPSLLTVSLSLDSELFNTLHYNISVILNALTYGLIVLFVILKNSTLTMKDFGIRKIIPKDIIYSLICTLGLFFISITIQFFVHFLSIETNTTTDFHWYFYEYKLTPLVLISCLTTGFKEEIFFRSYALTQLRAWKIRPIIATFIMASLFSLGHLYEGFTGLLTAFFCAIFLSYLYNKHSSLFIIAIGHGLFNFSSLMLSNL